MCFVALTIELSGARAGVRTWHFISHASAAAICQAHVHCLGKRLAASAFALTITASRSLGNATVTSE
jgi:hypothetical protein